MPDPPDVPRPGADGPSELSDRLRALRGDARVGAVVLACVALAAGVAWFRAGIAPATPSAAAGPATSRTSSTGTFVTTAPTTTTSAATSAIVIDVVGAVRSPGVVSLSGDARVIDAIRAAGGAGPNADLSRLNLAAKLTDGTRVAVPKFGQPSPAVDPGAVSATAGGTTDPGPGPGAPAAAGAPVDVNSATVDQLETLPGIGPTLGAAIVQERERNGPFRSVDDLNRVPGIGDGRLSQLRDLVTVG